MAPTVLVELQCCMVRCDVVALCTTKTRLLGCGEQTQHEEGQQLCVLRHQGEKKMPLGKWAHILVNIQVVGGVEAAVTLETAQSRFRLYLPCPHGYLVSMLSYYAEHVVLG